MAALAESVVAVTSNALAAVANVRHLAACDDSLRSGVAALRQAYQALGLPPPELPPEYLPSPKVAEVIPLRRRRRKKVKEGQNQLGKLVTSVEVPSSCWDPEPVWEASRCRALLLEVVRRAIHDWVLYRQHERLELKQLAHDAYVWLFEEEWGHPQWEERNRAMFEMKRVDGAVEIVKGARGITSFLSICDLVGMSPETVRARARKMTVQSIMHAGRPAEHRKAPKDYVAVSLEEHGLSIDYEPGSYQSDGVSPDDYIPYTPDYL